MTAVGWQSDAPSMAGPDGWVLDHHALSCCGSRLRRYGRADGIEVIAEKHAEDCRSRPLFAVIDNLHVYVREAQRTTKKG